ncbi:MAG: sigma-54 dependent transcriptional regulator [Nitrospirota bacterium]
MSSPANAILVVEDDAAARQACRILLEDAGYQVQVASTAQDAVQTLAEGRHFDLVLTDLRMPGMSGLDLLAHVQRDHPGLPVAMMTAHGSSQQESEAFTRGVRAFIPKPFTEEELLAAVEGAIDRSRLAQENEHLRRRLQHREVPHGIIGGSDVIHALLARIDKAAAADCTVLITGESGTGKELVARAIHRESRRAQGPFLTLNCGAVPEALLESELFGYVKGAFTGADAPREGLLVAADRGTLFLDEIGDLAPTLQVKILRALQEREITPVGSHEPRPVDVRILTATHRDLREAIAAGEFREDLYYRLEILPVHVPPLRERRGDIPLLAEHFLEAARKEVGNGRLRFSPGAMARMVDHPWPGNVRELQNAVTRAAVLADTDEIDPIPAGRPSLAQLLPQESLAADRMPTLAEVVGEAEKAYLIEVLTQCQGNQIKAAAILGINRRTLYNKLQLHGIKKSFRSG